MKKIMALLLVFVLIFSMPTTAFAASPATEELTITIDPETEISIIIPIEYANEVGAEEIESLISGRNFNNGDVITIQNIGYLTDVETPSPQPRLFESYETDIWWRGSEWEAQDYFVTSVAKGQTKTLSAKFSKTLSTGLTAGEAYVTAEIGASITVEYDMTVEFKGPPEDSACNTREYRVQFYARTVKFDQYMYDMWGNLEGVKSGTANVPTRYLEYNIDHVVS